MGGIVQEKQEKEAIRQLKAGNLDGLEFLYELHHKTVFRTAYGIVHNHHRAEDVTQQVFIELFTAIKRYDLERPFLPWLYKVAVHKSLDRLKRRKYRDVTIEEISGLPSADLSPEEEAEQSETKVAIWNALGRLEPKHRAVVVLRYYHGYSGAEIAQIVGCPHGTVRRRLNTARRRLRVLLSEWVDPPDSPVATGHPQHPVGGPNNHPNNGYLAESVLTVAKQDGRQLGAASEQLVGGEL